MLPLLLDGQIALFTLIIIAIIISLSFHEFGHAQTAKWYGDDTAERMGRLTVNPIAHIDPMGLLMVVFIGFGYAKPVPTDPRNFNSRYADLFISAAGPFMNLLLAFIATNVLSLGISQDWSFFDGEGQQLFFRYFIIINIVLMIFNLIPLGALDGHYILPYFLPRHLAHRYRLLNAQYGNMLLLGLMVLSIVGVPVFQFVFGLGNSLIPYLRIL